MRFQLLQFGPGRARPPLPDIPEEEPTTFFAEQQRRQADVDLSAVASAEAEVNHQQQQQQQ